jgi:beta-lactam-binding protein with PASTA domain
LFPRYRFENSFSMSEIKEYLQSKIFRKNLGYALGILFFLLIFTSTCTRFYTLHNRSLAVPEFTNMSLDDAIKLVKKKRLKYEIFDSLYVANKAPGTIIDQHPKPGSIIKKRRTIFFTICSSSPERIAMPNLVGITLREGKARLESYGLMLGSLSYRYDISKNIILEQRESGKIIQAGDSVSKGSSIDLVLGRGLGDESQEVPNLIGLTIEQAKLKLAEAMFSLGATVSDGSYNVNDKSAVPIIYRQKPTSDAGILVPLGSTITVWASVDSVRISGGGSSEDEDFNSEDTEKYNETDSSTYNGSYTD